MVEQHVQELLSNASISVSTGIHWLTTLQQQIVLSGLDVSEFSAGMESYNYCWTCIFVHAMQILNFQTWLQNGS
jgi:hypothetical protein